MVKTFKPMLGCDMPPKEEIKFPVLASPKLDGIRCIFHPEMGMISRSLKQIPNKQLQEKFAYLVEYSKNNNIILDGELYHHDLTFQQITSLVMTQDFEDFKKAKQLIKNDELDLIRFFENVDCKIYIADDLNIQSKFENPIEFHCFDMLYNDNNELAAFALRCDSVSKVKFYKFNNKYSFVPVINHQINSIEELEQYFKIRLEQGYEGLILRNPMSLYKFGRATQKEQGLMKYKPWNTYDAKIIGVVQEHMSTAQSTKNELGASEKSHKKEFMVPIDRASAFEVEYEGKTLKVSLAMTHKERDKIWKNKETYIGRMIEFKGMDVGAKNVPRHPVFVRFRQDKD